VEELNAGLSHQDARYSDSFKRKEPLLLRNVAANWPAIVSPENQWKNIQKLKNRFVNHENDRLVRVEQGENYMDSNAEVLNIPFSQFLSQIAAENDDSNMERTSRRLYLAQQELTEVPELMKDIAEPEMCRSTGYKRVYKTNIWFGGSQGSCSPCHYDPYDNILVQVVGQKEVILFSPSQTDHLYPALGSIQKNTSLVNISNPDYNIHPQARHLRGYRIILKEGDGLYIPKKWWHFIYTNSLSVSVNFWWT
jgi:lysine-specific demethylase 8